MDSKIKVLKNKIKQLHKACANGRCLMQVQHDVAELAGLDKWSDILRLEDKKLDYIISLVDALLKGENNG